MSNKYSLKKITVISCSVLSGIFMVFALMDLDLNFFFYGSQYQKKDYFSKDLQLEEPSLVRHTNKLSNPISVHIEPVDEQKFEPGVPFHLVGSVILQSDAPRIDIQWSLSENVQVVEGDMEVAITEPKANQVYNVFLTILIESEINEQIHLHAGMKVGKMKLGNGTMYNTIIQKQINKSKQELFERMKALSNK